MAYHSFWCSCFRTDTAWPESDVPYDWLPDYLYLLPPRLRMKVWSPVRISGIRDIKASKNKEDKQRNNKQKELHHWNRRGLIHVMKEVEDEEEKEQEHKRTRNERRLFWRPFSWYSNSGFCSFDTEACAFSKDTCIMKTGRSLQPGTTGHCGFPIPSRELKGRNFWRRHCRSSHVESRLFYSNSHWIPYLL